MGNQPHRGFVLCAGRRCSRQASDLINQFLLSCRYYFKYIDSIFLKPRVRFRSTHSSRNGFVGIISRWISRRDDFNNGSSGWLQIQSDYKLADLYHDRYCCELYCLVFVWLIITTTILYVCITVVILFLGTLT